MDEYISKQDMLNAVEKLDIIPSVDGMGNPTNAEDFRVQFLGTVLKVKPVDVTPVVRCKDCKNWSREDYGYCFVHASYGMAHDDFCSYGERKD